jgi:hypothetical protein
MRTALNHPENPNHLLLTELFKKSMRGDEVAQREYFACLAAAKYVETVRHLQTVQRLLRTTKGF